MWTRVSFNLQNTATLTLLGSTVALICFVYWAETSGRSNHKTKSITATDYKVLKPTVPESEALNGHTFQEFSFKSFMERRKRKLRLEAEKRTGVGKINVFKSEKVSDLESCVTYKTKRNGSLLCVHSDLSDPFISSHIRSRGTWEPEYVKFMIDVMLKHPKLDLVDIGCNVGAYTMPAAVIGRKVVAIDPVMSNLFLLHSSLVYADVRKNVTLLLNAVGDKTEKVVVNLNHQNIGGSGVQPLGDKPAKAGSLVADALVMDDLLRVVNFKNVMLKMDIEGYEANALRRAERFFSQRNVLYIMMEWIFQRHSSHGKDIIKFLTQRHLYPYEGLSPPLRLDLKSAHTWPDNIIWIHSSVAKHPSVTETIT